MANTMAAPVANSVALATKYLPLLDEVYKRESLSSILDTANERVNWIGADTAKVMKLDLDGLGNYSRNAGYVPGSADVTWETLQIEKDRGRSFNIDVMDNDETLGMMVGNTLSEFERTQIVPEIDAYRFAKYAANAGTTATATLSSSDNIADLIQTAEATLDDYEVPYEGRILFVNPTIYSYFKGDITRFTENGDPNVNGNIEMYDGMRVIRVPSGRFNTSITLAQPTDASSTGGFSTAGVDINFMIIHPSAIMQVSRLTEPRIFSPDVVQEADAWQFDFRQYHGVWVKNQKKNGIYVNAPSVVSA